MTSGDDHQYEDIDNLHGQAGQGQSQANTLIVGNTTHNKVLAALRPNPMYAGVGTPSEDSTPTSGHDQTVQGQSQAIAESNTNTTPAVVASGHDQTGQGQSQDITTSYTNTTPAVTRAVSGHAQIGRDQSRAITESYTNTTAAVTVSGHGQTGSQAIAEPLDTTIPSDNSHDTGPTAKLYSLYKVVRQYQAMIRSDTNTTAAAMTSDHDHQYEDIDPQHDQTGQGQSRASTEPNTDTTATALINEPHLNEDVDSPLKSPKPQGLRQFAESEALGTGTKNKPPEDEPPPLPPPRRGADALPAVSEPHLYEDVDAPRSPKSPKPKGAGLRQVINNSLGTANKNKPPEDEPPALPPHGKCTDAQSEKSAEAHDNLHVYENHDLE
ncbi:Hypp2338 [Branchiostoma lanceolatum]|uniref:Hypp2338 protein n=1 Tax=Branchiostoma lanceolatum TaxID=7740 RepID=A0A8J9ZSZ1_BRALA|nr:Hypp2338 [Branchiostoma lanceolatum]